MLPMIFGLCQDKSWRVRYMVADKFYDLSHASMDCIYIDRFVMVMLMFVAIFHAYVYAHAHTSYVPQSVIMNRNPMI